MTGASRKTRARKTVEPPIEFGDRLRIARRHAGISQEELAESIGVSQSRVAAWEAGVSHPRGGELIEVAKLIEEVTGVDAAWLLSLHWITDPPVPQPRSA